VTRSTYVIGMTGGIGSGKTAVAAAFAALGIEIIDTDACARLVRGGSARLRCDPHAFGERTEGPTARSVALRRLVFADATARSRLEGALHPLIGAEVARRVAQWSGPYGLIVVPLLLERKGPRSLVDRILVVDCPEEEQVRRVVARNGLALWSQPPSSESLSTKASRCAKANS
jgi:dephospho-CoA kinase